MKALVVEDSKQIRNLLTDVLEEEGYVVVSAGNGIQALGAIEHARPDVVLMDLGLPDIDGDEVVSIARSRGLLKHVPVIFVSASSQMDRIAQANPAAYLAKPFELDQLLNTVHEFAAIT